MTDINGLDTGDSVYLRRAYDLDGTGRAAEALYDEWADTYEADTAEEMGYRAPVSAADKLAEVVDDAAEPVLDAGCGTGLVGLELARRGFSTVDGYDISTGMLAKARATGVYRTLTRVDLTGRLPAEDDTYGALICVGTLTEGHVGPEVLAEFIRVVRPGGVVVATILEAIWESRGYAAAIDDLVGQGAAVLLEAERAVYRERQNAYGLLPVLQVV